MAEIESPVVMQKISMILRVEEVTVAAVISLIVLSLY